MLTLAHPSWLFLLPVLALAFVFAGRRDEESLPPAHLVHPNLSPITDRAAQPRSLARWQTALIFLAACLMTLALAQPQWLGPGVPDKPLGRDIMLVVDASSSMAIDDFVVNRQRVTRLDVLKDVAQRFVAARDGDRFGLIVFGDHAATLAPPSFDRNLIRAQLARLQNGIAGESTAIGDALGLALKQVKSEGRLQPTLILFSDGDSTTGEMKPSEALVAAQALGVKIYTVEIGTDLFASPTRKLTKSTEPSLAQMAVQTGAKHYVAGSAKALQDIIADIGRLEPTIARPTTQRQIQEWYWAALLGAVVLLIGAQVLALRGASA
ncbi:MAG: VWA domain-containing protein [Thiobacillus sp.]